MSINSFKELEGHVGHIVEVVKYGEMNVAIECIICGEVLIDFNRDEETDEGKIL